MEDRTLAGPQLDDAINLEMAIDSDGVTEGEGERLPGRRGVESSMGGPESSHSSPSLPLPPSSPPGPPMTRARRCAAARAAAAAPAPRRPAEEVDPAPPSDPERVWRVCTGDADGDPPGDVCALLETYAPRRT